MKLLIIALVGILCVHDCVMAQPPSDADLISAARHFTLTDGLEMWLVLARLERDLPLEVKFGTPEILFVGPKNEMGVAQRRVSFPYLIGDQQGDGNTFSDLTLAINDSVRGPLIGFAPESRVAASNDFALMSGYRALRRSFHRQYIVTCISGGRRIC